MGNLFYPTPLAKNYGLSKKQVIELMDIIEERKDEIRDSWERHFGN